MLDRYKQLNAMALAAMPTSDEDWGSERQNDADNVFSLHVEELGLLDDDYFHWALKATVEERVIEMWNRAHDASGEHRGGPECACAAECAFCSITHLALSHSAECSTCERFGSAGPSHFAMSGCRSGGRDHCTCDSCF